jgi:catechol 2,3-dioxygenase-like lactoylglutathione lyase family enzyme
MAKLRHIAIQVQDPEVSARFFREVFELKEMSRIGLATPGAEGVIYLSDGTVNVALIHITNPDFPNFGKDGLNHIGFVVQDLEETVAKAEAAGAVTQRTGQQIKAGEDWEYKMTTPDGVDFDIYDVRGRGWPGIGGLEDLGVKGEISGAAHAAGRALGAEA